MFDSVRTRLTMWYVSVLAIVLVAFSVGVYLLLARSLHSRLDAELRLSVEFAAASLKREQAEGEFARQAAVSSLEEAYFPRQAVAFFDTQGQLIDEKIGPGNLHARMPSGISIADDGLHFYTLPGEKSPSDDAVRVALQRVHPGSAETSYLIVVNQSLEVIDQDLEVLRNIFLGTVPLALALAGVGGGFLARKSLTPVVAMSDRARRISAENLEERLPVTNPRDELGRLAATFNDLLERLNTAFAQQRQFMADASHELRTPLSVLRTAAEVTLEQEPRQENEYREALTTMQQQIRRLTRLVEDMFTLAHADTGRRTLQASDFYLDELIQETTRAAVLLANRKGVTMETSVSPDIPFHGDEELLRQMILNLLDNAIKHTPSGGLVRVGLEKHYSTLLLSVTDTGAGIPPEAQSRIFERFYRVDKARSRADMGNGSGAGLGLSIARWIAEAHHGRLELLHSDEKGSAFVARLPAPKKS